MEKKYHIFAMPDAFEGFGIIAVDFMTRDGKEGGKAWKIKPAYTGTFDECFKQKKKLINIAKTAKVVESVA